MLRRATTRMSAWENNAAKGDRIFRNQTLYLNAKGAMHQAPQPIQARTSRTFNSPSKALALNTNGAIHTLQGGKPVKRAKPVKRPTSKGSPRKKKPKQKKK